jgi:hypothetical protein
LTKQVQISDYADAFNNRGVALRELARLDEALASYHKALALKPDYAEAFSSRGITLKELQRLDEATGKSPGRNRRISRQSPSITSSFLAPNAPPPVELTHRDAQSPAGWVFPRYFQEKNYHPLVSTAKPLGCSPRCQISHIWR